MGLENALLYGPYCGPTPIPAEIWWRWNTDPALIAALLGSLLGLLLLRDAKARRFYLGGLAVLAVAFVSPLCALTTALSSARALHHLVSVAAAAPLFALATPPARSGGVAVPLAVSTAALWLWHWPAVYEASFSSHAVYWSLQFALLGSFVWFWRSVLSPRQEPFGAVLAIGAGTGQMGLLAAVLTMAPRPLYEVHGAAPLAWGLDPLTDQQLGGLLMWVPGFFAYGVFALFVLRRLRQSVPA